MNGSCKCRKGVTGTNCDMCDRGTTGNIPYCTPCGECFDDWSGIIANLKGAFKKKETNLSVDQR